MRSRRLKTSQRTYYNSEQGHAQFMNQVDQNAENQEQLYQEWRQCTQGTTLENTPYPGPVWQQDPLTLLKLRRENPGLFIRPDDRYEGSPPPNWGNVNAMDTVAAVGGVLGAFAI